MTRVTYSVAWEAGAIPRNAEDILNNRVTSVVELGVLDVVYDAVQRQIVEAMESE